MEAKVVQLGHVLVEVSESYTSGAVQRLFKKKWVWRKAYTEDKNVMAFSI